MESFYMVVAIKEDDECEFVFDNDMNECLETTHYDLKEAEADAREKASELEQPHAVLRAVSVFTPGKRPVKKTTIK